MKIKPNSNALIWLIYIALLLVLWPHTAWAFSKFESHQPGVLGVTWGIIMAWALAFAFEATLAAFTHKLAKHIEHTPNIKDWWRRFNVRYVNAYGGGLFIAWLVSTLANLAHSVEFGQSLKILDNWGIPFGVYAIAFGAILPLTSLLFARVLSNTVEIEHEESKIVIELNKTIKDLNRKLKEAEQQVKEAEQRAMQTEQGLNTLVDLVRRLFGEDKQNRILAAHETWPELPQRSIAVIAETSVSTVNSTLKQLNGKNN